MKLSIKAGEKFAVFPIFQYLAILSGSLNILSSGLHYGWASPSLPKLLDESSPISITSDEASWVAVTFLMGAIVGALATSVLLDGIGRKNAILLSSVPFFASWMMLAYAQSLLMLVAGRFVAGIAEGIIFCAVPLYMGEISNPNIRGFLGSGVSVIWMLGILLINAVGSYLSIKDTALICSAFPVLLVLTFVWMPESPYYLIKKGDLDGARRSLRKFKRNDNVEQELRRLVQAIKEQTSNSCRWLDLFTVKSNRKALYVMMGTRACQQFSGSVAIMFYAQIIFESSGDIISPSTGSIVYFGVQLIISSFSSAVVDRTGRKPLMIVSIVGAGLALLTESLYLLVQNTTDVDLSNYSWVPLVALIAYVSAFSVGLQSIPVLLLGEIFPTDVKAFAVSFSDVYLNIICATASKFFQVTKDEFGMHVPFFVFTTSCVLGLLFVIFYVPETKGKTLEEIQDELKALCD